MKTTKLTTPVTLQVADRPAYPNQPAPKTREVKVSSLTLRQVIDDPVRKLVSVLFFETRFPVDIWKDEDYDKVGNWTQEQLESAVEAAIVLDAKKVITQALAFPVLPNEAEQKAMAQKIKAAFPNGVPSSVLAAPITKK